MPNDRDAWAAIRGYFYQVRRTILRWMELDDYTVLLCEAGEDIVLLYGAVDAAKDPTTLSKVLEQVKHRERSVTLRSPHVIEVLSNFLPHWRASSQENKVRFRFTTNAVPGHERDVGFPRALPGIEACKQLAQGQFTADEVSLTLSSFRRLIASTKLARSAGATTQRYRALRRFVSSAPPEELLRFLSSIEWAVGESDLDLVREELEHRLVEAGLASPGLAKRVLDRLTIVVLEKLSSPGLKRLDREALVKSTQEIEFSETEAVVLQRLEQLEETLLTSLREIGERVRRIDEATAEQRATIAETHAMASRILDTLSPRLPELAQQHSIALAPRIAALDEPPVRPRYFVHRQDLLEQLLEIRGTTAWIHLRAGAGMGKTHLARAFLETVGPKRWIWVSIPANRPDEDLLQHFDDQVAAWLVRLANDSTWWQAYSGGAVSPTALIEALIRQTGPADLVVVDDLPDITNVPWLGSRIQAMGEACAASGCTLLTTGQRAVIIPSIARVSPQQVREFEVPSMTAAEMLAMLEKANAPSQLLVTGFVELLHAATRGHPSLIAAAIRWLENQNWPVDYSTLQAILSGELVADEREAALRRMVAIVPNNDQREMLCRLSLAQQPFDRGVSDAVAAVEPSIVRPGEILKELVGPWVNQLGEDKFEVSPLVSDAGRLHLPKARQQLVHSSLADRLLGQRPIAAYDAVRAVGHLFAAERWLDFATFAVQLMASARTPAEAKQISILRFFIPPGKWPDAIPLGIRIMTRGFQVKVAYLAGEDPSNLQADLDAMIASISDTPPEVSAALLALMNTGPLLPSAPPGKAVRNAIAALRLMNRYPQFFADAPDIFDARKDVVWLPFVKVSGLADVYEVIDAMSALTAEEMELVLQSDLAVHSFQILADHSWADTSVRPTEKQDWTGVLAVIARLDQLFDRYGLSDLKIVALRAKAITLADYLDRKDEAMDLLSSAVEPSHLDLAFLRRYTAGQILFDKGDYEQCLGELQLAIRRQAPGFTYFQFSAHVRAAEAAERLGRWAEGVKLLRSGLRFALARNRRDPKLSSVLPKVVAGLRVLRSGAEPANGLLRSRADTPVPKYEVLEALGELGVAEWKFGRLGRACVVFQALTDLLTQDWQINDPRFREVFRKAAYAIGWHALASTGGEKSTSLHEGRGYSPPGPGGFLARWPQLADLGAPILRSSLPYLLGRLLLSLNYGRAGLRHLSVAVEASRREWGRVRPAIGLQFAPPASVCGTLSEAFSAALEASKLLVVEQTLPEGRGLDDVLAEIDAYWQSLPTESRVAAEVELFWHALVPWMMSVLNSRRPASEIRVWSEILSTHKDELIDPAYWQRVLLAARGLEVPVRRDDIVHEANALPPSDTILRCTLYFAALVSIGASPRDALPIHAILLDQMMHRRTTLSFVLNMLCEHIGHYWRVAAETKAFQLYSPREFRALMAGVGPRNDLQTVCRILLWAERATGGRLSAEIRTRLTAEGQTDNVV